MKQFVLYATLSLATFVGGWAGMSYEQIAKAVWPEPAKVSPEMAEKQREEMLLHDNLDQLWNNPLRPVAEPFVLGKIHPLAISSIMLLAILTSVCVLGHGRTNETSAERSEGTDE
jgi:hypothetical protein